MRSENRAAFRWTCCCHSIEGHAAVFTNISTFIRAFVAKILHLLSFKYRDEAFLYNRKALAAKEFFRLREELFEHREWPCIRHRLCPLRRTAALREDIDRLFTRKFIQPRKLVVDPLAHLSLLADVRIIHLDPAKMEYAAQDDISHEVR